MKFNKTQTGGILIALAAIVGCATGTVSEPVCYSQDVNFGSLPTVPAGTLPSAPVAVTLPPQSISFDLSDTVNKVTDVAKDVKADVTSFAVVGSDLNWVDNVDVSIAGASPFNTPSVKFASGTPSSLTVSMDDVTLVHYLESGSVTLTFTLSGKVDSDTASHVTSLDNNAKICMVVSGSASTQQLTK